MDKLPNYIRIFLIAIFFLIIAIFVSIKSNKTNVIKNEKLIKNFDEILKNIQVIEFANMDHNTKLSKLGNNWVIVNQNNISASANELRKFFINLKNSEMLSKKTNDPSLHSKLGLDDKQKTTLKIRDSNNNQLSEIEFGVYNFKVRGTYIKYPNNNQTYLVSENLKVFADPLSWISRFFFNIGRNFIEQIIVYQPSENHTITINYDKEGVSNTIVPNGYQLSQENDLNILRGSFQSVEIEDYVFFDNYKDLQPIYSAYVFTTKNDQLKFDFYLIEDEIFTRLILENEKNTLEKQISNMPGDDIFELSSNIREDILFHLSGFLPDNLNIILDKIEQ